MAAVNFMIVAVNGLVTPVKVLMSADESLMVMSWSSLVVGDEGWIGPSKKMLCLC